MFNIIILGIVSLLTDISSEMIYPLLPFFLVLQLGASPALLGFIEGVAESLSSFLKVFSGYWSDKIKKRKTLTISGYAFSLFGKFFLYISSSWGLVFLARILDRFGKGVRTAPRDALIADSSNEKNRGRNFGLHRALDTLGACLGILLAYLFFKGASADYSKVFFIALIPAVLGLIALFWVKEKQKSVLGAARINKPKVSFKDLIPQFKILDKRLKAFLIITFLFSLANSSNQFLLLRAKTLGFNTRLIILLYLAYNVSYALFSYPAGVISDKIGRKILLISGYVFYSLVYFGFAFVGTQEFAWVLFAVYGIYMGLTEGVEKAFVSDLAPVHLRATFIGMHAALAGIGLFFASFLAGGLWDIIGVKAPFIFGGIMSLLAAVGMMKYI
ncbi:MAG: MFS transporter [Candidatus Omnitrophota bacterium]|nr:MFS transporter [Candidatus Omnitrophota bacterium]